MKYTLLGYLILSNRWYLEQILRTLVCRFSIFWANGFEDWKGEVDSAAPLTEFFNSMFISGAMTSFWFDLKGLRFSKPTPLTKTNILKINENVKDQ